MPIDRPTAKKMHLVRRPPAGPPPLDPAIRRRTRSAGDRQARLRGHCNAVGGFGHALEPDLRSPSSQSAPTLHALVILEAAGAADSEMAADARASIASIAAPGGGIPFVLPDFESTPMRRGRAGAARAEIIPDARAGHGPSHPRREQR